MERFVQRCLETRSAHPPAVTHKPAPEPNSKLDPAQQQAVRAATRASTVVITGGPGTGKTTIVNEIVSGLDESLQVALAAPTGKAAARLQAALGNRRAAFSGTLHRLLGLRPSAGSARYNADNPLPYDVVILDETSMVSLQLMAFLLDAVPATTRLILIGDANQLRSVQAGAVLADIEQANLVGPPGGELVRLRTNYRSHTGIQALAQAILDGEAAQAREILSDGGSVSLVPFSGTEDPMSVGDVAADALEATRRLRDSASLGRAEESNSNASAHRLLCGHRQGPFGTAHWGNAIRQWLASQLPEYGSAEHFYVGQPLLLTQNSGQLHNGDTAVVIAGPDGQLLAAVDRAEGPLLLPPWLLDGAVDMHALTIHKAQGSQFERVSVVLPPPGSPLLTRELLYTAVTRAKSSLRLIGSWEALDEAIATPARRASGLGR